MERALQDPDFAHLRAAAEQDPEFMQLRAEAQQRAQGSNRGQRALRRGSRRAPGPAPRRNTAPSDDEWETDED